MHIIVAIVGMTGSGKSTAAGCLVDRGWLHIRFGQATIDRLKEEGKAKSIRRTRRRCGNSCAATMAWVRLALLSLSAIEEGLKHDHVVIDGMYSWSEHKILKEAYGDRIHVVAVVSSPKTRYERLEHRVHDAKNDPQYRMRPLKADEARKRDHAEIENIEKGGPIAMADFTVVNESMPQNMIDALLAYVDRINPSYPHTSS